MYKTIDLDSYERREHFRYFNGLAYPYVGVTAECDLTAFDDFRRRSALPFFLTFLYLAASAANDVPELRRRIRDGGIIEYDGCGTSHTVMTESGAYAYCNIGFYKSFSDYLPAAEKAHALASQSGGIGDEGDPLSFFYITTLPWIKYTSLVQPVPCPADSNPRISWGRCERAGGRALMPVTLLVNHALADGLHISRFFGALEERLASPQSYLV